MSRLDPKATTVRRVEVITGGGERRRRCHAQARLLAQPRLEDRIMAAIDDINCGPIVHSWSDKFDSAYIIRILDTPD